MTYAKNNMHAQTLAHEHEGCSQCTTCCVYDSHHGALLAERVRIADSVPAQSILPAKRHCIQNLMADDIPGMPAANRVGCQQQAHHAVRHSQQ